MNKKIGYVAKKYPYTTLMTCEFYEHRHSFWEFVLCIKGEGIHFVNDSRCRLRTGDLLIMKPDSVHDYKLPDKNNYAHYDFYASSRDMKTAADGVQAGFYDSLAENREPLVFSVSSATLGMLEEKLSKLNILQSDPQFEKLSGTVYGTLLRFICGMAAETTEQHKSDLPEWLARFLANLSRPEALAGNLAGAARASNFSRGHLCRLFRRYTGTTLSEYFSKLKLDYATVLLKNKELGILDISLSLGYGSLSHFIGIFKKYHGITPKQYRKRLYGL